jgi:hypothetical protein
VIKKISFYEQDESYLFDIQAVLVNEKTENPDP